jgi:hypothetical protein
MANSIGVLTSRIIGPSPDGASAISSATELIAK